MHFYDGNCVHNELGYYLVQHTRIVLSVSFQYLLLKMGNVLFAMKRKMEQQINVNFLFYKRDKIEMQSRVL